jgi:hypothetical protein
MNKQILKNLLTMLQSDDEDNHYMAMKTFANLEGVDDYREELLFLWLYGIPDVEEWALADASLAETIMSVCGRLGILRTEKDWIPDKHRALKGDRWLNHLTTQNVEKPWVAELIIEEVIKDKKQVLKALDFKFKDIEVKIIK